MSIPPSFARAVLIAALLAGCGEAMEPSADAPPAVDVGGASTRAGGGPPPTAGAPAPPGPPRAHGQGSPPGPQGPPGPPPSGGGPPLPPPDGGPPEPPRIQGPEASVSGRIPLLNQRPKEAEGGGQTLWIRGTVPGVAVGQVRFHSAATPGAPLQVICLAEIIDGRFEAEAPPEGPDVYVSVVALPAGAAAEAAQPWGALEDPVPLAGADHEVSLVVGARAAWTERLQLPPDRVVGVGDVHPR